MNNILLKVSGKNINNFLLKMASRKIEVINIKVLDENNALILVDKKNLDFLEKIKGIYEYEVIQEDGFKRLKKGIKDNIFIIIFLLINIILIKTITNYIYEIEIIENNHELKELISNILNEKGIRKYARKSKDLNKTKTEILKENKNYIEWIEIIESGLKYIVKVEERIKNNNIKLTKPTNIIASKDGVVKKIIASRGKVLVEKETYVKKGDTLITGIIDDKNYVEASGKVLAEVWKKVRVSEPLHVKYKSKTGKTKKGISVVFLNKRLTFYKQFKVNEIEEKVLFRNDILPIYISLDKISEVNYVDHIRTISEAKNEALKKARLEITKELDDDEKIISENELKVEVKDSKIIVDILYTIYEYISVEKRIEVENVP